MKKALYLLLAMNLFASTAAVQADDGLGLPAGTRLKLQTVQPLPDNPAEVAFLQRKGDWLQVEYERSYTVRGESGAKTEKVRLWVNSQHIISVRILEAQP